MQNTFFSRLTSSFEKDIIKLVLSIPCIRYGICERRTLLIQIAGGVYKWHEKKENGIADSLHI